MLSRISLCRICSLVVAVSLAASSVWAAQPSEKLLPETTKGALIVPDVELLVEKWEETQFGKLFKDAEMQEFIEDFREQLREKLAKTGVRLGITLDDVGRVAGGEVCLAVAQPEHDAKQHAMMIVADVTGKVEKAEELMAKVSKELTDNGAKKDTVKIAGEDVTAFTIKAKEGAGVHKMYYKLTGNYLVVADHAKVAEGLLLRVKEAAPEDDKTLSGVEAFKTSMAKCAEQAGDHTPHLRWYVDPFGYAQVLRAANGDRERRGKDMLKILTNQGFTNIEGIGGYIALKTDNHEVVHWTYVHAPGPYSLAARMLDFPKQTLLFSTPALESADGLDKGTLPMQLREAFVEKEISLSDVVIVEKEKGSEQWVLTNEDSRQYVIKPIGDQLDVFTSPRVSAQPWIPVSAATYLSFKWNLKNAFESSRTLVDELIGTEGSFDDVMKSIEKDPNGPQINVQEEFVKHLSDRVTLLTDYRLPITPKSERLMFAVELNNPEIVSKTVNKAMEHDPDAKKRVFEDHIIWEIVQEDMGGEEPVIEAPVDIFGEDDFGPAPPKVGGDKKKAKKPNAAVMVAYGHLIITSHVDFARDLLKKGKDKELLADSLDYEILNEALDDLGAGKDSFRVFSRTDEAYRPTYELIRDGKMPEAETLVGKFLNGLLGPEEEGVRREQQVDGSKLPPFDAVRRYLGPSGTYVNFGKDGWLITGCVLSHDLE